MNRISGLSVFILLCLLFSPMLSPLSAQRRSPRAIELFRQGIEKDKIEDKIQAYQKAIEIEPYFVEALFNLAMAYKQNNQNELAREYLIEAYKAKPNISENKLLPRILYNLANIEKRMENYGESEKLLKKAARYAKERALQSKIQFELGRLLYEMRRYDEALLILEKGQEDFNKSSGIFQNLVQIIENEQLLESLYNQAESAFNTGDFSRAQMLFRQIHSKKADYKDIDARIAATDSLLNIKVAESFLNKKLELASRQIAAGKLEEAITTYDQILSNYPNHHETKSRANAARVKFSLQQKDESVKKEYSAGIRAIVDSDWTRAILAFEKVHSLDPDFRDTRDRLEQANQGLEKQSTETILSQYYRNGIQAMDNNELGGAYAAFEKVYRIDQNYRNTRILMSQVEKLLQASITSAPVSNDYFNTQYDLALTAMQKKDWIQAILVFEKIKLLAPGNQSIAALLSQARENLKTQAPSANKAELVDRENNFFFYGGMAVLAMVSLPILGFVAFSPVSRARFHSFRGDYLKAAHIYERLLAKNPQKIKFYSKLANTYLIMGRNDERAVRVYRMVLNLDISSNLHQQIRAVVPNQLLIEGEPGKIRNEAA